MVTVSKEVKSNFPSICYGWTLPCVACLTRTARKVSSPDQCSRCRPSHSETLWLETPWPNFPLQTAKRPVTKHLYYPQIQIFLGYSLYRNAED